MHDIQDKRSIHVSVGAAFFRSPDARWLDNFISDPQITSRKIPPPVQRHDTWHKGRSAVTSATEWVRHFLHGIALVQSRPDVIVTCFPPLSIMTAVLKRSLGLKIPLIVYNFNLGGFPTGPKRRLARWAAQAIDIAIVHSPSEVNSYAHFLGVNEDRVRFVPLQRGDIQVPREEETRQPYLLAMGSAHRDYQSLVEAVAGTGLRTIIVARAALLEDLHKPTEVEFLSNLSSAACMELLAGARISVTPIDNTDTASGQITFINAMKMGVPVIATDCPGTEGYIAHNETGLLVPPRDVTALRTAILALWSDTQARAALARTAREAAEQRFSDTAAARGLASMIQEVAH